jgi:hypothetical protein
MLPHVSAAKGEVGLASSAAPIATAKKSCHSASQSGQGPPRMLNSHGPVGPSCVVAGGVALPLPAPDIVWDLD